MKFTLIFSIIPLIHAISIQDAVNLQELRAARIFKDLPNQTRKAHEFPTKSLVRSQATQETECPPCGDPTHLQEIFVVFSNHLDIGFTKYEHGQNSNSAGKIVDAYFHRYWPWAMETAKELRSMPNIHPDDSYIYVTHPFLLSLYFDCPPNMGFKCPSQDEKDALKEALDNGDVIYQAAPFNYDPEMAFSKDLIDFSFKHTHMLDTFLGQKNKTVISQRDVPSLTINTIPIAVKNGIRALSIGVNEGSAPVVFPHNEPFIWKHANGDELMTFYHPGGYGWNDRVQYLQDCPYGVVWAWETDNARPHTAQQVVEILGNLRKRFSKPGKPVRVVASDLETVVDKFEQCKRFMKTVDSMEAGDTWIYGVPSDPFKTAAFRHLSDYFTSLVPTKPIAPHIFDPILNATRLLMFNLEHTWGGDCSWYLGQDYYKWWPQDFEPIRKNPTFQELVDTWVEQRHWGLDYAVQALPEKQGKIAQDLLDRIMKPARIDNRQWSNQACFQKRAWKLCIDPHTSGINHLEFFSDTGSRLVADKSSNLGLLEYREMEDADFGIFGWAYMSFIHLWFGFGKVGLPDRVSQRYYPKMHASHFEDNVITILASYPEECYGCPRKISIQYTVKHEHVKMDVSWREKKPTRMPETFSILFDPILERNPNSYPLGTAMPSLRSSLGLSPTGLPLTWHVDKLGMLIDTNMVLTNGSQHIHGFSAGVGMPDVIWVSTLDAGVALIGNTSPLPIPLQQGSNNQDRGMAINVFNNAWGTNFPQWYPFHEGDDTGRVVLDLEFEAESLKKRFHVY